MSSKPKKITAYLVTNEEEKTWIGVTDDPYIGSLAGNDRNKVRNALILALVAMDYEVNWVEDINKQLK